MPVNIKNLRVQFEKQVFNSNQFKGLAKGAALSKVKAAQQEMLETFEAHKVTQEIAGGPNYAGKSIINYFSNEGNPNLYSFIGFREGVDPLKALRELLSKPIEVQLLTRNKQSYFFKPLVPTTSEIENATPMPDDYLSGNLSWARGIEDGDILGIGQYLTVKASASRSGGGIQVEFLNLPSTIEATPYISEILEAFKKRLSEV